MACVVFDTSATHARLVRDIACTSCWSRHGCTHGHNAATFKHQFSAVGAKDYVSVDRACDALSLWVPFNSTLEAGGNLFPWSVGIPTGSRGQSS